MKTLVAGIVLIILVGFAGFLYRNVAERTPTPNGQACTLEARLCPDGSSVGRVGPTCEFAPCAYPNIEDVELGIRFAVPEGYMVDERAARMYVKPATGGVMHTISVQSYPVPDGESANEIILANTRYQPADMTAEDFSRFETLIIDGREFRTTVIERFEAIVHSAYFLAEGNRVLRFDIVEHDVVDWMEPTLSIKTLPEHAALLEMLGTLEF